MLSKFIVEYACYLLFTLFVLKNASVFRHQRAARINLLTNKKNIYMRKEVKGMLKILNFKSLAKGLKNTEGKTVIKNTIFRSGVVSYASKSDIRQLQGFGVEDIYDFRSNDEIGEMPPLATDMFKTRHFDILDRANPLGVSNLTQFSREQLVDLMKRMYSEAFAKTEGFRPVIESILDQDSNAFLYHCSAGKDRTGVFSAILMMLLDFDIASIRKEYERQDMISMFILKRKMAHMFDADENEVDDTKKFDAMMLALPEYINAYIAQIFKDYGSFDAYLSNKFGITPVIKAEFKNRYLI